MNFFLNRTGRTIGQTNQWTKRPSIWDLSASMGSQQTDQQGGQPGGSRSQQSPPANEESTRIGGYGYVPPEQRAAERMVRQQEAGTMDAGGLSPNYSELFKRRKRPVVEV